MDQSTAGGGYGGCGGSGRGSGNSTMLASRRPSQLSRRPSPSMSIDAVHRLHCSHMHTASTSAAQPSYSPTTIRANPHAVTFDPRLPADDAAAATNRPRSWSQSATASKATVVANPRTASAHAENCHCSLMTASMYGSFGQTRRPSPPRLVASTSVQMHSPLYQGEMFVLRDRQFLI